MKKPAKKSALAGETALLARIAKALERLAPASTDAAVPSSGDAFVWEPLLGGLVAVPHVAAIDLVLLKAIESQRDTLIANTQRFAGGLPANNALLWGARGMGKSSLVKSVHAQVAGETGNTLALVEFHREDIATLPRLLGVLAPAARRFVLFCDDLSFDAGDSYRSLKGVLEGGVEGRPDNVILYATSNRRHLMPRDMIENERSTAIRPEEGVDEKVSLSDRFGLWLGFHPATQDEFLAMVDGYAARFALTGTPGERHAAAIEWSMTRGARSGRVAWQFIQDLAGRQGKRLD